MKIKIRSKCDGKPRSDGLLGVVVVDGGLLVDLLLVVGVNLLRILLVLCSFSCLSRLGVATEPN